MRQRVKNIRITFLHQEIGLMAVEYTADAEDYYKHLTIVIDMINSIRITRSEIALPYQTIS